ncbi:MAG: DNA recombination protein RmuC [Candidatus Omnitrophica bacterium]|nr:DNA recombination protein RmuC [Candidatus Omnitrophota bacterium]MDD5690302.1 DNA recombination protein RmuC [Candidatus Omnitrophota bacterium]
MVILIAALFLILAAFIVFVVLKISSQVNERLNQMNQSIQEANKIIGQNLGSATSAFGGVKEQLGKLEETNKQIIAISKDISSLQELLRAPKFRGAMGETLLDNLLSQVLPREHYHTQYRFKSADAVDAVICLGERLVPVDAKFSLENFQRMQDASDEQAKETSRKKFIQDVKNRINEIAAKYILPAENTYDFALMYIPAENVYYEIIIKEDIFSYSMLKKVIPVSPNTFYAYLQVICMGLRGLKVEENAKLILKSLGALSIETDKFKEDFGILGSHLLNANTKYADAEKRLDKVSQRLTDIQDTRQITGK